MTIKIRQYKRGGFEVDIRFTYPDGTPFRRRYKAPVESKSAARRWGEGREAELLKRPSPTIQLQAQPDVTKEVPTLREFGPRYMQNHAHANRQKASSIHTKERILANHLYPALGDRRLDAIRDEDVQGIKAKLSDRARKTVNCILVVLSHMLKTAVKWKILKVVPCSIEMLKESSPIAKFYDFDDYKRLVEGARAVDPRAHLVALLERRTG